MSSGHQALADEEMCVDGRELLVRSSFSELCSWASTLQDVQMVPVVIKVTHRQGIRDEAGEATLLLELRGGNFFAIHSLAGVDFQPFRWFNVLDVGAD